MPIRARDLRTRMLPVAPDIRVGAALKDIGGRERAEEWLLLYPLGQGYAVIGVADLARRSTTTARLLDRRFRDLGLPPSPTADIEAEPAEAQALLGATGYVVVLRDDEPYGVLVRPAARPPASLLQMLLSQAATWQPSGGVLGVDEHTPRSIEPPPVFEPIRRRADRYVNTDFAADGAPGQALPRTAPLQPGRWYVFRLSVGEAEATSDEAAPTLLPDAVLEQDAEITVVVFSESFAFEQTSGVLSVPKDEPASVKTPAWLPPGLPAGAPLARERLLFRARAPEQAVRAELRVSMYCNGMLIQSRLVTAVVGAGEPLTAAGAMRVSALDFNLSPSMAPSVLNEIAPHKLSLMVNSNGDGTHAFRLFSQEGNALYENSATMAPAELADLLNLARGALQRASWGYAGEWDGRAAYRYDPSTGPRALQGYFQEDLFTLAAEGARFYAAIKNALGRGKAGADELRELMRAPGVVQLANKISASDIVPIALLYDYKLDSQASLTVCPAFEASLASGRPLIDEPCFRGDCPSRDNLAVVCPSGFWGFRHDIGMPCPVAYGPDLATTIAYGGRPLLDAALYADFPQLAGHLARVDQLDYQTQRQTQREQIVAMFHATQPQVVYFYCHGVLQNTKPSLKVGSEQSPGYFTIDNWSNLDIGWPQARPLFFINGCHTTAITPAQALNLVRVLVEDVAASGVIGTEITIFEPLAQAFAEAFLRRFRAGAPLGRAVREARLGLLAARNLLGLVYLPHAYAELKLAPVP